MLQSQKRVLASSPSYATCGSRFGLTPGNADGQHAAVPRGGSTSPRTAVLLLLCARLSSADIGAAATRCRRPSSGPVKSTPSKAVPSSRPCTFLRKNAGLSLLYFVCRSSSSFSPSCSLPPCLCSRPPSPTPSLLPCSPVSGLRVDDAMSSSDMAHHRHEPAALPPTDAKEVAFLSHHAMALRYPARTLCSLATGEPVAGRRRGSWARGVCGPGGRTVRCCWC